MYIEILVYTNALRNIYIYGDTQTYSQPLIMGTIKGGIRQIPYVVKIKTGIPGCRLA